MTQYIDKSALVVEIEKRLDELWDLLPNASDVIKDNYTKEEANITGKYTALESFEKFINTIEVKEVDLDNNMTDINFEEEIDNFMYGTRNPERFPDSVQVRDKHTGLTVLDWKWDVNNPKHKIEFAKYFFELGLKTQKGK